MPTKLCQSSLAELAASNPSLVIPKRDHAKTTGGIVHIGVGNFHRAHQCVYTDDVLERGEDCWGIIGVGLMAGDSKMRDVLKEQDMHYSLWQKGEDAGPEGQVRIMRAHVDFVLAHDDPDATLQAMSAATTKIITLTVTEKGYFVNLETGHLDMTSPVVAQDIETLKTNGINLKTAAGFIVAAARRRKAADTCGFAVLSCDNVQENGHKARTAILELAEAVDSSIVEWIKDKVTFPNSMVDRITPATTDELKTELAEKYGITDAWPVCCESFLLWVVEDKFPEGRPAWEKSKSGKCIFVEDVVPYELMKLRLLNAVHQALAYPASLLGHELVHDAMADRRVSLFLKSYMAAAARTVPSVKGLPKKQWIDTVVQRFSNPAIRDTIFRLNEDATNRIGVALAPCFYSGAVVGGETSLSEFELEVIALPVACWVRCLLGDSPGALPAAARLNRDDRGDAMKAAAEALWAAAENNGEAAVEAAVVFLRGAFGDSAARTEAGSALLVQIRRLQSDGVEKALSASLKPPRKLTKPTWMAVKDVQPELRNVNLMLKCVSLPEDMEVVCGDDTGRVTLLIDTEERAKMCQPGASLRLQNSRVSMKKNCIRLIVDKWAVLRPADSELSCEVGKNDISAVEYEFT